MAVTTTIPLGPPGVSARSGDHICALYRGHEGRDEILLPFLRAGIESGHKCVAVLDEAEPDEVTRRLDEECPASEARATRQLDIRTSFETYLAGGRFSQEAMLAFWDAAIGEGHTFARALGEMTWARRQFPGVEGLVEYEAELNKVVAGRDQVVLCMYDLDQFTGSVVVDLLRTHPRLLVCGTVIDNPYYLEPQEFLAVRAGRN